MKNIEKDTAEVYKRLQEDVDSILAEVGHFFDDVAEYVHDGDPLHQLDIDKVLKTELKLKSSYRPIFARAASSNAHPSHKVVRSMPKHLQEEVKIYEKTDSKATGGKALKFLLKRLEF